jgi:hypothetical protein
MSYYVHPRYRKVSEVITSDAIPEVVVTPVVAATSTRRSLSCINLGSRVDNGCKSCWKNQYHNCNIMDTKCRPAVECQQCPNYVADSPNS